MTRSAAASSSFYLLWPPLDSSPSITPSQLTSTPSSYLLWPTLPPSSSPLSPTSSFHPAKPSILKKQQLIRDACALHRDYFQVCQHKVTNAPTSLIPIPIPSTRSEMSITKALKVLDPTRVIAAVDKEIDKVEIKYGSLVPIDRSQILKKSLWLRSQILIKEKLLGEVSARLAIDGSKQPFDSYNSTYSGTSSTELLLLLLSTCVADAAVRGCSPTLTLSGFDIKGAFLHCDLTPEDTNGYQFLTTLPKDLPGPKAGQLRAIVKGQYGIKQSNNIFNSHLGGTLEMNGYHSEPLTPYIYSKRCPQNPSDFLAVNTHVDDGAVLSTSSILLAELKSVLTARFGELTWNDDLEHFCGIDFQRLSDHSIKLDVHTHLLKYLHDAGMDRIPGALTPTLSDFFDPPSDPTPFDSKAYKSTQGNLLFYCPIRYDIKMPVHHLSKSNNFPTVSDRQKQYQILRYLKAHPNDGPCFSSDPLSYPNGVQLTVDADSSHASLPNCQDQTGILYRIGQNNAPFSTHASAAPGIS